MDSNNKIPVVILAGGFGTRLGEETSKIPKPLVKIGQYPILVHIMSTYLKQGFDDFIILGGYKCEEIKNYFYNFESNYSNIGFEFKSGVYQQNWVSTGLDPLGFADRDWQLRIIDTGLFANTSERLWRASKHFDSDKFFCTYGDGLSTINLNSLLISHVNSGLDATLTAFHPPSRFGEVRISRNGLVENFEEKPLMQTRVNGGFFVFEKSVISYCKDNTEPLESGVLSKLAAEGRLGAYASNAWWQMMDTPRELKILNDLWDGGNPPWLKFES